MKHSGQSPARGAKTDSIDAGRGCRGWIVGPGAWAGPAPLAKFLGGVALVLAVVLIGGGFVFALFTLYFFRDPDANTPDGPGLVVSPGHGKVDVIEQLADSQFPGGPCHRISMFLSVIDIHVQNAPVGGRIACVTHTAGSFINAMQADSALHNENVLVGFDSAETPGEKIGVRLIAGVLARRIVPFVSAGRRGQARRAHQPDSIRLPLRSLPAAGLQDQGQGGRQSRGRRNRHGLQNIACMEKDPERHGNRANHAPVLKIYFLPNLMTAGNLFFGFVALTKIVEAQFGPAGNRDIKVALVIHPAGLHLRFARWPPGPHGRGRKPFWPGI